MRLWLGTHEPHWLATLGVPLFVSHVRLARPMPGGRPRPLPRAIAPWALDSGGFTQLSQHGRWIIGASEYVEAIERYSVEVGQLAWAAPQDWMCEPFMVERTGLSVREHQARTITSVIELRAAGAPVVPVLQGYAIEDYLHHVDAYIDAGIELGNEALVGLGSVCRRQATTEIEALVRSLTPLRLHGFGVKTSGLRRYGPWLTSADSLAWSYNGRRIRPCPVRGVASCNNCAHHALAWRARALAALRLTAPCDPRARVTRDGSTMRSAACGRSCTWTHGHP